MLYEVITSGGLLIAVEPEYCPQIEEILKNNNMPFEPLGILTEKTDVLIEVR